MTTTYPVVPVNLPDNTYEVRARQQELLADANDALKEKVDWIIEWYRGDTRHSLLSRWELGSQIGEILLDQSERGCRVFGSKAFRTVAAFSGEAEGSLRVCARLAELYSRSEIASLSEQTMADEVTPLSFSHIRAVLSLDDADVRQAALDLALERSWTSEQLSKYVKSIVPEGRTNNREGRPVARPKNLDAVIHQQMSFAEDFEKRNVRVWRDPEHLLTGQLAKVTSEHYTEELATQIGSLAHKLRQLADEAGERATEAEKRFRDVRNALDKKYGNGIRLAIGDIEKQATEDAAIDCEFEPAHNARPCVLV